jgi:hypothetical protein
MISYYHLQYKLHRSADVPIEKEEWIAVSKKYSPDQMKQLLIVRHQMDVTLVSMSVIPKDEYDRGHSELSVETGKKVELSKMRVRGWNLANRSHILKTLDQDSKASDDMYRNIPKPPPLL